jgi:hypothetical protein
MSEAKTDWIDNGFKLLEKLPPELLFPVIIGGLMVAVVWFFRSKGKDGDDKKEPTASRNVHIGKNVNNSTIQTGDNNRANSKDN